VFGRRRTRSGGYSRSTMRLSPSRALTMTSSPRSAHSSQRASQVSPPSRTWPDGWHAVRTVAARPSKVSAPTCLRWRRTFRFQNASSPKTAPYRRAKRRRSTATGRGRREPTRPRGTSSEGYVHAVSDGQQTRGSGLLAVRSPRLPKLSAPRRLRCQVIHSAPTPPSTHDHAEDPQDDAVHKSGRSRRPRGGRGR